MKLQVPQPIPYQGSKRKLAPLIMEWFPDDIQRLVEPFAGSAAITIAAASQGAGKKYWINDAHKPLIALWRSIILRPEELAAEYEELWGQQKEDPQEFYRTIRQRFNEKHNPADFLYILARCVKAAIRYNRNGEFNNTPDKRRLGAKPCEMRRRIAVTSRLLDKKAKLSSLDFKEVLAKCSSDDLIYMDPPYQGVYEGRDARYLPTIKHDDFCDAVSDALKRKCSVIISYDGKRGDREYGKPIPKKLGLRQMLINAGASTQATLLGRKETTFESLYVSKNLKRTVKQSLLFS